MKHSNNIYAAIAANIIPSSHSFRFISLSDLIPNMDLTYFLIVNLKFYELLFIIRLFYFIFARNVRLIWNK